MPILENDSLRVEIAETGAELQSIRTADGAEWLWHGDAAWWAGRSPILFPVVGLSPDGHVTIAGQSFPMGSHGFARHSRFRLASADAETAVLELRDDAATRASYPLAFSLRIAYRLQGDALHCDATVENLDDRPMPFQFGFHPAFLWPLPGAEGQPHRVTLENGASPAMHRPDAQGLIDPAAQTSSFVAGDLTVRADDFQAGAMVFSRGAGHAFTYGTDAVQVRMRVTNLPNFALWQKPGAPYLCLEPWHGTAPFPGQGPALEDRTDRLILPPGQAAQFGMELRFLRR